MWRAAAFLAISILAGSAWSTDASAASPKTVVVRAGDGEAGFAVNAFLPEHLTIEAGTTVRWEFPWWEPHTVTFGIPQTGAPQATPSGSDYLGTGFHTSELLFGPGKSYEVRFPETGEFQLYCIIHPGMTGTVTVVDPGEAADDQATIDARARDDYDRELASLKAISDVWAARPLEREAQADGTTLTTVYIAGETPKGDVQRFFPPEVQVQVGDTVRWRSTTVTEHTVTFGPFPTGLPRPGNPLVDTPSVPGAEYDGSGYWNSGTLGLDSAAGTSFEMTFGTRGTFYYYCIPHADQGMTGVIHVDSRATPPTPEPSQPPLPPSTGSGLEDGPGAAEFARAAGALCLIVVISGVGLALANKRRRRSH